MYHQSVSHWDVTSNLLETTKLRGKTHERFAQMFRNLGTKFVGCLHAFCQNYTSSSSSGNQTEKGSRCVPGLPRVILQLLKKKVPLANSLNMITVHWKKKNMIKLAAVQKWIPAAHVRKLRTLSRHFGNIFIFYLSDKCPSEKQASGSLDPVGLKI